MYYSINLTIQHIVWEEIIRLSAKIIGLILVLVSIFFSGSAIGNSAVPEFKNTKLGKYVISEEAFNIVSNNPDSSGIDNTIYGSEWRLRLSDQ